MTITEKCSPVPLLRDCNKGNFQTSVRVRKHANRGTKQTRSAVVTSLVNVKLRHTNK